MEKKEIINYFFSKNVLVSPDVLDNFQTESLDALEKISHDKITVINKDLFALDSSFSNWNELEASRVLLEKGRENNYVTFIKKPSINFSKNFDQNEKNIHGKESYDQIISEELLIKPNIKIVKNFVQTQKKINISDFIEYFKIRYKTLREILLKRQELQDTISINRVLNKKDKEKVAVIGMLMTKDITKNDNFILQIEDLTGVIKVIIGKRDMDLYNICKEIMLDETLGFFGSFSKGVLFAERIIFPDIPLTKEFKKSPDEVYVVCTSDIHVGSRLFHKNEFLNFIEWLNGNFGDENQKNIAKKVKYLVVTGDLVAGVGVYPGQDKELTLKDINDQYKELGELLNKIRKDIFIILCPGDHDAVMVNEPQPILDKDFSKSLYELSNVSLVTNPAFVNIHSSETFSGFDFLLYHGHSFIYYANTVDHIRNSGWTGRGDLIMKYLLQRRHLSPTHGATTYLPESGHDPLVIDIVPDFLVSGHLHQISNLNYRNVSLIGCGCWEALTPYQEKTGNKADPGKVTLVNLKTRELKILNFLQPF